MANEQQKSGKGPTAWRKAPISTSSLINSCHQLTACSELDPACGTCRKKCRKCDRKRPICDRCRTKGLHCEGYPPRFQFCEMVVRGGASNAALSRSVQAQVEEESPPEPVGALEALIPAFTQSPSIPASFPPDGSGLEVPTELTNPSPSVSTSPYSQAPTPPLTGSPGLDHDLQTNQALILHFDRVLSTMLSIHIPGTENPFKDHILPLAYQHQGVLHALLGLSACHMYLSGKDESSQHVTTALQYRVSALHSLASLLLKEESAGLSSSEEEFVLAMVLLLVFHDICETGVSTHGAHLTGVSFLCGRLACPPDFSRRSRASMFFVSALSWLDMLRGFSGAEKLSYSEEVRKCVRDHGSLSLHTLVGCPPVIFYRIGQVLQAGKEYLDGSLSLDQFKALLDDAEKFFRGWDPNEAVYPTRHEEWKHLAEAYRHACLLRVLRFPDTFVIPCEDERIKASVAAILDVCAAVPRDSVFYKRLLFPLFLAGAETISPHQTHYASWCIGEIKHSTGFQHPAMTDMLTKVWEERKNNTLGWTNVPWMEFTCSTLLQSQHAYLFF
ncbi:fungal-specific transcription factor domain-containing protein [Thelonectria olida]|uniref:Fungal-specific transcription factor domain-containing protein n=1 Tax=Thelonectria olida TaxID=1576542 RepID=A0A9P8VZY1_9HYPO|nr:fungal-specific transcription factor domain-containing protein [Thelonectria olida]